MPYAFPIFLHEPLNFKGRKKKFTQNPQIRLFPLTAKATKRIYPFKIIFLLFVCHFYSLKILLHFAIETLLCLVSEKFSESKTV
jgi:hypothetical protein